MYLITLKRNYTSIVIEEMESRGLRLPSYWEGKMFGGRYKPLP